MPKKTSIFLISLLIIVWLFRIPNSVYLDSDLSRDLNALADLYHLRPVWLGPQLSIGFPTTPVYYFYYLPLLWLFQGQPFSLWFTQAALGLITIIYIYKYTKNPLLSVIVAISPVFLGSLRHPGNGFIYVLWLQLFLVLASFSAHLWLQALVLGAALACHPAAIVGLPLLIINYLRSPSKIKNLLLSLFFILLPWTPILIFEFITKGFLLRQFFSLPQNFTTFTFPPHYFFGLNQTLFWFFILFIYRYLSHKPLYFLLLFYLFLRLSQTSIVPSSRNLNLVSSVVDEVIRQQVINQKRSLNIISVLSENPKTPAGDDFRFFFKMNNFPVLDTFSYSQSQQLIVFNESLDFDWNSWRGWEKLQYQNQPTQQIWQGNFHGIQVTLFDKI